MPTTTEPPIAKMKGDEEWLRTTVESTVRQWFPYMALQGDELERVKEERGSYFKLPQNMSGTQVRDEDKLVWQPLPKHVPETFQADHVNFVSPSVRLENPPVDPTFGHGRTVVVRDREMAEYRQELRAANAMASNTTTPIFQADFLLVQLPGRPIALHTVSNGVMLHSATDPEVVFTTLEYDHTPQPGVPGLWGTFKKKENPAYNPKDVKSGAKYVRHYNVSRQWVVVCNVMVSQDTEAKALRIHESSLKELAEARPLEFAMPKEIPSSHAKLDRNPKAKRATARASAPRQNKCRRKAVGRARIKPSSSSNDSDQEEDTQ